MDSVKVVAINPWKYSKNDLLNLSLSEFASRVNGTTAEWSRWFSGARDIKASSLLEPACALGISPGELLDIILERQRRHLESDSRSSSSCNQQTPESTTSHCSHYSAEGWSDQL